MIHVTPQLAPLDFAERVHAPGEAARLAGADPLPPHWRRCLRDLHAAYDGICAYAALRIHDVDGVRSVDHFRPKGAYPALAYVWENYRLACTRMNGRKGDYEDVLDPFEVVDGWFVVDFTKGAIGPAPELVDPERARVVATIARLGLDDDLFRNARLEVVERFLEHHYSFDVIRSDWPHLAFEIERQQLPAVPPPEPA